MTKDEIEKADKCHLCQGYGTLWNTSDERVECPVCHGSGIEPKKHHQVSDIIKE